MTAPFAEPGLFDMAPAVAPTPISLAQIQRDLRPTWTPHTGKHTPCQACVRALHAAGSGPLPNPTRLVRTVKATGERTLLCGQCAEPIRKADEAASPKRARTKVGRR